MAHRFALLGCGGMGRRHLRGFAELAKARPGLVELAAVIDVALDRAEFAASEAEELLGSRPRAFSSLEAAVGDLSDLAAVDIVTIASTHHTLAVQALELGLHVLVEKPMSVTMRGCRRMREAAESTGRSLSIAENYRRDPISRLARALLESGAIGERRTVLETHHSGGDRMMTTPWRHRKEEGGPMMEMGVHYADMLIYFMGSVRTVYGLTRLVEPERVVTGQLGPPGGFYDRFSTDYPEVVKANAPDSIMATLTFESGAWGQFVLEMAARGPGASSRVILGSQGRIDLVEVRSGKPLSLWRDTVAEAVPEAELLELVPDFALDELTAELFGGERLTRYAMDFTAADRKLLALEVAELATAIDGGAAVEVGPDVGEQAVAVVLAMAESNQAGRPVTVDELRQGALSAYQDPIDRTLGLLN